MDRTGRYVWLAAGLLVASGCGSRYADLCAEANDCANGNELDEEGCIEQLETQEERASIQNCDDEWDVAVTCFESHNECDENEDGGELQPTTKCTSELEDLDDCMD